MTTPNNGPNFLGAPQSAEQDTLPIDAFTAAWDRLDIALDEGNEAAFYEALDLLTRVAALRPTSEEDYDVYFGARRTLALERIWHRRVRGQQADINDIQDAQRKLAGILADHAVDPRGRDPDQHGLMVTLAMALAMRGHGLALTNSPRRQLATDEFGIELPLGYVRVDSLLELNQDDYIPGVTGICMGKLIENATVGNLLPHEMRRRSGSSGNHWASFVEYVRRALVQEAECGRLPDRYGPVIDKAVQNLFKLIERPARNAQRRRRRNSA